MRRHCTLRTGRSLNLPALLLSGSLALLAGCGGGSDESAMPVPTQPPAPPLHALAAWNEGEIRSTDLIQVPWLYPSEEKRRDQRMLAEDYVIAGALAKESPGEDAVRAAHYELEKRALQHALAIDEVYNQEIAASIRPATSGWLDAEYERRRADFDERHWWWFQFIHFNISPATPEAAAIARAEEALAAIREGEGFTEAAARFSESDAKGAVIGPVANDDEITPVLKDALRKLEIGEVSGPIAAASSVKIVRLLNHEERAGTTREKALSFLRIEFSLQERERVIADFEKRLAAEGGSPIDAAMAEAFRLLNSENAVQRYHLMNLPPSLFANESLWPVLFARTEGQVPQMGSHAEVRHFQVDWALASRMEAALGGYQPDLLHWPAYRLDRLRLRDIAEFDHAWGEVRREILDSNGFKWMGAD